MILRRTFLASSIAGFFASLVPFRKAKAEEKARVDAPKVRARLFVDTVRIYNGRVDGRDTAGNHYIDASLPMMLAGMRGNGVDTSYWRVCEVVGGCLDTHAIPHNTTIGSTHVYNGTVGLGTMIGLTT